MKVHVPNSFASKGDVVYCDGHVESPTLEFLFEDTSDAALACWNRDHLPHREKMPWRLSAESRRMKNFRKSLRRSAEMPPQSDRCASKRTPFGRFLV